MARPSINLLLFQVGHRQHRAVVAASPEHLVWQSRPCPLGQLAVQKKMAGKNRQVGAGVDINPEVPGQVAHGRVADRLDIEDVVIDHDGRNGRRTAIERLRLGLRRRWRDRLHIELVTALANDLPRA